MSSYLSAVLHLGIHRSSSSFNAEALIESISNAKRKSQVSDSIGG